MQMKFIPAIMLRGRTIHNSLAAPRHFLTALSIRPKPLRRFVTGVYGIPNVLFSGLCLDGSGI